MTVTELLYYISELIVLDKKIKNVKYPNDANEPQSMIINLKNGKKYGLYINELKQE